MDERISASPVLERKDEQSRESANAPQPWEQPRGPVLRADGRLVIGRVGAPPGQQANSSRFFFWVPPEGLVEKTQLVTCESRIAGKTFTFYALVEEVYRCGRASNMGSEIDVADGNLAYPYPLESEGYTYASASILRVEPSVMTPPRERSEVFLASAAEARLAYGADEVERPLAIGLIKNGGTDLAGPGIIDLDYLLGTNGGHLNVNGTAGRGTKSSFLLHVIWLLLYEARRQAAQPSDPHRLRVVPIIFNVKNFDLFYIDQASSRFDLDRHGSDWRALGVDEPRPFTSVTFYAPQQPASTAPIPTGRLGRVSPYSWSLSDIVELGLLSYLFAEADVNDLNFSAIVLDVEHWLSREATKGDGTVERKLRDDEGRPATFRQLLNWVDAEANRPDSGRTLHNHHDATWKKLHRRLLKLVFESRGILRRDDQEGRPLRLVRADTSEPVVIDLSALAAEPELQRFVVATIFRQLVESRTGANAIQGLVYLVAVVRPWR
jgi:hypothetical protein